MTADDLYECAVMHFGIKNVAATLQWLMYIINGDFEGCIVYLDDIIIFSDIWQLHMIRRQAFFLEVEQSGLVIIILPNQSL